MPEQIEQPRSAIEATYKGREFEGIVDLYFYRKIGFWLARLFARLNMSPAAVTLIGGVFGIIAGHLYYFSDLRTNMIGMVLHVVANAFDNADGQLARLTNRQSRIGRILDPFVDHLVWLSIYVHLALRCGTEGASSALWFLIIAAAISHALQAAMADYCRNAYLYFAKGRADLDTASALLADYRRLRWRREPWEKFLLALYLNATREQELLAPGSIRLRNAVAHAASDQTWLQQRYRELVRPTFKWWGLLMTNTRMLLLFVILIVRQPVWYFWIELTVFNVVLVVLILRQERISRSLVDLVVRSRGSI